MRLIRTVSNVADAKPYVTPRRDEGAAELLHFGQRLESARRETSGYLAHRLGEGPVNASCEQA